MKRALILSVVLLTISAGNQLFGMMELRAVESHEDTQEKTYSSLGNEVPSDIYSFPQGEWSFWSAVHYSAADLDNPECLRKVFEKAPNFEYYSLPPRILAVQDAAQKAYDEEPGREFLAPGREFSAQMGFYYQYIKTIEDAGPKCRKFILQENPGKLNDIVSGADEPEKKRAALKKHFDLTGSLPEDLPHFYGNSTSRDRESREKFDVIAADLTGKLSANCTIL